MKRLLADGLSLLPNQALDRLTRAADWLTEAVEWAIFTKHARKWERRFRG